jgi:hypothetical protein
MRAIFLVLAVLIAAPALAAERLPAAIRLLRHWTPAQEQALRDEAASRPHGDPVREAIIELESLHLAACSMAPRQPRCRRLCTTATSIRYGWCS